MSVATILLLTGFAARDLAGSTSIGREPHGPSTRSFPFLDGGALRVVERGPERGTDADPVPGVYRDPGSGRSAVIQVGDSVLVRLPPGDIQARFRALRLDPIRALAPRLSMWLVRSEDDEDAAELANRLVPAVENGDLVEAWPNLAFRHRLHVVEIPPNDPRYASQFYLEEVDIEAAWATTTGSADVTVLVADNGCDLDHPDLVQKMDPGFDPFENDDDPSYGSGPGNEHGTACAGLIAASTDNGRDIAGTCPECRLRCARLLPADGEAVTIASDVLTFNFALETDVDVVSNSWGFVESIPVPAPLRDAIIDVQQNGRGGRGAVVVFASGNDNRLVEDDELLAVPGVLGVGAVNNLGELTQFSNGGRAVDVVAPTGTITTDIAGPEGADPGDVTVRFGGTSSACPVVAGVAALLIAYRPDLTADDVNEALVSSAKQSIFATPDGDGHDDDYGYGLIQPSAALALLADAQPADDEPDGCSCRESAAGPGLGRLALALLFVRLRRRGTSWRPAADR